MTRQKPSSCSGCALHSHGTDFSQVEGTGSLGILLVGEASGEHEQRDGLPFRPYAPAGGVLERVLRRMGLDRKQFAISNVIRCRPRNNWLDGSPWEYSALRQCRPNLDAVIQQHRPRVIVALGGVALRELTGEAGDARGIGHLAGYVLPLAAQGQTRKIWHRCSECNGEKGHNCLLCGGEGQWDTDAPMPMHEAIPVIGDFHPAYLRRGKSSHQGIFARIIQRAINIANGSDREWIWGIDPSRKETHGRIRYQVHPSLDEARDFAERVESNSGLPLSYDLETYESASLDEDAREGFTDTQIRLIQFSLGDGTGIAFPWEGPYRELAQRILHSGNVKCGHNIWLFDNKVLRAASEREGIDYNPRGVLHDTLQMFHHWQPDLPAHLQFCAQFVRFPFPWKHLAGTDIEFYGCADVDATLRLYNFLRATLERDALWGDETRGYLGQIYHVRPVLAGMEDRGMPIDDAARLRLDGEFDAAQQEILTEIQSMVPDEIRSIHPKEGYKKLPKDLTGLVEREFSVAAVSASGEPTMTLMRRWCRLEPFNPNSSQQLMRYMKAKGHPIPKDKHREDEEGNNPDTTGKKEIVRLSKKVNDTFYLKVIGYRELSKVRGTYIDGFKPHADGRVHTTFTFDTGIGQLASKNPNVQNFIKHGRLATATRGIVCAPEGQILSEWDLKSCHVLTLGFLAEDEQYIRCARIDMHTIMTGHFLKLWDTPTILRTESDDQIRARCKWLKSIPEYKHVRDAKVKHAGLGIGNGLREKGLYERYMEMFDSQKEAGNILKAYEGVFTRVFAWQKRIQQEAHEKQMIRTQFGHIRRFYEVFRWDYKRAAWGHGDQAEEAIAYWLANIAFGHIREKLKAIHRAGFDVKYGLFNNIHDSFLFCFPEHMREEHVRDLYPILSAPSEVLRHPTICPDGLVIDVDGAWGKRWNEMEEIHVKEVMGGTSGSIGHGSGDAAAGLVAVGQAEVTPC